MINFMLSFAGLFFNVFQSKKSLICEIEMLKKELQILKRKAMKKRISTTHQGINQNIPKKYLPQKKGKIIKLPILSGLHHHYFREAA